VSYATVSATPLSVKSEREKSVAVTARSIQRTLGDAGRQQTAAAMSLAYPTTSILK